MKLGTIFDIKKYALHDGPGIRTTVFFKGCSLNCQWCHNPESRKPECEPFMMPNRITGEMTKKTIGRKVTIDELMSEIIKDRIFYEHSGGGVTFSGGEPLLQSEFLAELMTLCKDQNLHTIIDSSGHVPFERFQDVIDLTDQFYFDIKILDSDEHKKYIGVDNRLILENLEKLNELGVSVTIRVPMIPGITDTDKNLKQTAAYLSKLKNISGVSLLPFNKFGEDKRKRFGIENRLAPMNIQSDEEMRQKTAIFESLGFAVSIGG